MEDKWELVRINFHGEFISGLHNDATGATKLILIEGYKKPMMDVLNELEAIKKERDEAVALLKRWVNAIDTFGEEPKEHGFEIYKEAQAIFSSISKEREDK